MPHPEPPSEPRTTSLGTCPDCGGILEPATPGWQTLVHTLQKEEHLAALVGVEGTEIEFRFTVVAQQLEHGRWGLLREFQLRTARLYDVHL